MSLVELVPAYKAKLQANPNWVEAKKAEAGAAAVVADLRRQLEEAQKNHVKALDALSVAEWKAIHGDKPK